MGEARSEAIEAMDAHAMAASAGDLVCNHAALLDAIPATVLARLAIERGGLEPFGWHRCDYVPADHPFYGEPPSDHPDWRLSYRLTEEPRG